MSEMGGHAIIQVRLDEMLGRSYVFHPGKGPEKQTPRDLQDHPAIALHKGSALSDVASSVEACISTP